MPSIKSTYTKYSYSQLIELSLYSDLKSSLTGNVRLLLSSNTEYADTIELLTNLDIQYVAKSKREIWIT